MNVCLVELLTFIIERHKHICRQKHTSGIMNSMYKVNYELKQCIRQSNTNM